MGRSSQSGCDRVILSSRVRGPAGLTSRASESSSLWLGRSRSSRLPEGLSLRCCFPDKAGKPDGDGSGQQGLERTGQAGRSDCSAAPQEGQRAPQQDRREVSAEEVAAAQTPGCSPTLRRHQPHCPVNHGPSQKRAWPWAAGASSGQGQPGVSTAEARHQAEAFWPLGVISDLGGPGKRCLAGAHTVR